MPTITTTDLPSDDEPTDLDFVAPPSPSSSASSSSSKSRSKKRVRSASPVTRGTEEDPPAAFSYADLLDLDRAAVDKSKARGKEVGEELVTVRIERIFAGGSVWEEKQVLKSSEEAQAYLALSDATTPSAASANAGPPPPSSHAAAASSSSDLTLPSLLPPSTSSSAPQPPPAASSSAASSTSKTSSALPAPPPRRPPPKKKRGPSLEALASAASGPPPKKITTMEKSAMDWRAHTSSSTPEAQAELARNRQEGGAGYLAKMDFLGRVEERTGGR